MSQYDTDKIKSGIINEYEKLFGGIKTNKLNILEIGVHKGGSLLWAADYFSHNDTKVHGIDIEIPALSESPTTKKINMVQGNQKDREFLMKFGATHGTFDIIIDDGCHYAQETANTFHSLWPFVKDGGFYIIEDWAAEFRLDKPEYADLVLVVHHILKGIPHFHICEAQLTYKSLVDKYTRSYAIFKREKDLK